jgi:hypothetical protein
MAPTNPKLTPSGNQSRMHIEPIRGGFQVVYDVLVYLVFIQYIDCFEFDQLGATFPCCLLVTQAIYYINPIALSRITIQTEDQIQPCTATQIGLDSHHRNIPTAKMPTGSCLCQNLKYEITSEPVMKASRLDKYQRLLIELYRLYVTVCLVAR